MNLFLNTTSPYARIVRIALAEKLVPDVFADVVDPWADAAQLLNVNSAGRVPTLVTDDGTPLTESLLIVMWLESRRPEPSLLGAEPTQVLAKAGIAMGVIDAAVHTLIGRKITDASFDRSPVGLRRRRSIVNGLTRLESNPPRHDDGAPDLAAITTVVALDYVRFRFADASWLTPAPKLDALAAQLRNRPSFDISRPGM